MEKLYSHQEEKIAENRSRDTLFERRENLQRHASYASERLQYDAIKNGQTDRVLSIFQKTPDGTPGVLSRNELRNSKNISERLFYSVKMNVFKKIQKRD